MGGKRAVVASVVGACALLALLAVFYEDGQGLVREAVHPTKMESPAVAAVKTNSQATPAAPAETAHQAGAQQPAAAQQQKQAAPTAAAASSEPVEQGDFPALAEKFHKGVVQIMVVKAKHEWLHPEGTPKTEEVSGSGWFIDNKYLGPELAKSDKFHIVTNGHVAIDALKIEVRLPVTGLTRIAVKVVGLSPPDQHDLALLQIVNVEDLKKAFQVNLKTDDLSKGVVKMELGSSDGVKSGEKLMALGYPEGLPTVKTTLGDMSGYQEMEEKLYMQMTTPINPGNSGGPLLNHQGEVIGVNTAGIEGSENIGFAIPAAVVKAVLPVLASHRVFVRPVFGIVMNPTTPEMAELFGMPEGKPSGEYIAKVYNGSLADKAGLKAGDVLYELDGMPVDNRGQMFLQSIQTYVTLTGYLERTPLGSKITMKIWRKGGGVEIKVPYTIIPHRAVPNVVEGALHKQPYLIQGGLVITPLTQNLVKLMTTPVDVATGQAPVIPAPGLLKYSHYPHDRQGPRLVVSEVISSSVAEETKVFQEGMVIDKVNGKKVRTMEELCGVVDSPSKDAKGKEWLTVTDDMGNMGAMLMSEVALDDKQLVSQNMYTMKATVCPSKKDKAEAKATAKKVVKKALAKAKAKGKGEGKKASPTTEKVLPKKAPKKSSKKAPKKGGKKGKKADAAVAKQMEEKGSFMQKAKAHVISHKVVTMPGEKLRVLQGEAPEVTPRGGK